MMIPGLRVVRGPDWCYDDVDGGVGYLGTVVKELANNTVCVQWDVGTETICRAGQNGVHDLRIYDNAQTGVAQKGITCDGKCLDTDASHIYGIRWKCLVCFDRDNCTSCYMSLDDVCINHPFVRYLTPNSTVDRVPPRRQSDKVPLSGIFPGSKVTRRVHNQLSQDADQVGIVKEMQDIDQHFRSAATVDWGEAPKITTVSDTPIYRVGANGKVDLKLIADAPSESIYIQHLPVLDISMPMGVELKPGNKVRVDAHQDTFKFLMHEHCGWIPGLENVLGEEGIVKEIKDAGRHIVSVKYEHLGITIQAMYTNILTKVTTIKAGDVVDITNNEEEMKTLQQQHGGWQPSLKKILGCSCTVVRVHCSNEAVVEVNGESYLMNTGCLSLSHPEAEIHDFSRSLTRDKVPAAAKRIHIEGDRKYIGARVVRGPHWSPDFGDQDGGEGHLGTVVEVYDAKSDDNHPHLCVTVQWDCGEKNVYRCGLENVCDLRIYDNASIGVKHDIPCTVCGVDVIFGMLWRCRDCEGVNMCSECYNKDEHNIEHKFTRIETNNEADVTDLPKRSISKKMSAFGIFEKCQVRRGPDWRWTNQDGGEDKQGEVIAVVNFSPDTDRDAAEITWKNGYTNVYRLGYRGRLDVVCVTPVLGGYYYRDHIPILKLSGESDVELEPTVGDANIPGEVVEPTEVQTEPEVENKEAGRFEAGDKVRIEIDADVLRLIEENRGAWNYRMTDCIGHVGTVLVTQGVNITVDFLAAGKWTFHESVLNKVREFVAGETVQVKDNINTIKMLQTERGGWNDLMSKIIGRKGTVEALDEDGDIQVCFGDYTWTLNPECCLPTLEKPDYVREDDTATVSAPRVPTPHKVPETNEEKLEELFEVILTGEKDRVRGILQRNPELALMDLEGRFAVHCVARCGQVDTMKILFDIVTKDTLLEMRDNQEMTPLLTAVEENQTEMVQFLKAEGADMSVYNKKHYSAVHLAVNQQNSNMLTLLSQLGFSPNLKDELDQTPIFEALTQDDDQMIRILLNWPNIDIHVTDGIGFTPFFLACRKGHTWAVEKILEIDPDEISARKEDNFTGLHLATFNGNKDVVKVLLKQKGVQLDGITDKGMTSLHLACSAGFGDIIVLLGDSGAKQTAINGSRQNCLHLYFEGVSSRNDQSTDDFKRIVEYLVVHGVPVDRKDESDKLPEDYIDNTDLRSTYERIKDAQLGKQQMISSTSSNGSGITQLGDSFNSQGPGTSSNSGATATQPPTQQLPPQHTPDKPALCESCEEEQVSVLLSPCGHTLCSDCAPRKKQKKKLCAICGGSCTDMTQLQ